MSYLIFWILIRIIVDQTRDFYLEILYSLGLQAPGVRVGALVCLSFEI